MQPVRLAGMDELTPSGSHQAAFHVRAAAGWYRRGGTVSSGGTVTIRGRVPTYYEKQLAINSGRRVAGVVKLVDDVVVGSEEEAISS